MQPTPTPSLALRGGLAIALMVLFYALGAVAIFLLVRAGLGLFESLGHTHGGRGTLWIAIGGLACLAAAGVLAWSLLPRFDRFHPPGPELLPSAEPALFAEIAAIARATGQAPPAHVYAILDMNAFVTQRGGLMGFGSRRVMGLGIPLMQLLTVAELRAVIAHEFGHFHGGDTKLGPWVYKTRGAIGRAVDNLGGAAEKANAAELGLVTLLMLAVRKPFVWFGQGFMRITQAVSRGQEIAADALACRVVGSEPLAAGLQKSAGGGLGYQIFLREEVSPLIAGGRRPAIVEGFSRFVAGDRVQALMQKVAAEELAEGQGDPYDSHPPLRQRVEAARALAAPTQAPDERPALTLLADPTALELASLDDRVRVLPPIAWEDAIDIYRKAWQQACTEWRAALVGLTPATLPFDAAGLRALLAQSSQANAARHASDDDVRSWGRAIYRAALGECLLVAGFGARTAPGEPIEFTRDGRTVDIGRALNQRFAGELDADGWLALVTSLGIADAPLVAAAPRGE